MKAAHFSKVARLAVAAVAMSCSAAMAATTCRSLAAASAGSSNGYNADIQAADAQEQKNKAASDILGQCVASVTGVLTIPTFPTLDEILNQIKNKICRIASQQVHSAVSNVSAEINAALQGLPTGAGPITIPPPSVSIGSGNPAPLAVTPAPAPTPNSSWLSRTWR